MSSAAEKFRKRFSADAIEFSYQTKILGSKAVGLDRVDDINFQGKLKSEVSLIAHKVDNCTYKFTKYKEKLISKGALKAPRQLSIPTIRDRLTLRILCDYLFEIFPEAKPELPQAKIERLREAIDSGKYKYFIKIDLQDFYSSVSHKVLLGKLFSRARLGSFKHLIKSALQNPTVSDKPQASTKTVIKGVAQGLSISNVLAEIMMLDVDNSIKNLGENIYQRYVDDILILSNQAPEVVLAKANQILRRSKLNPHPLATQGSKTKVGKVQDGLDFLGYVLDIHSTSVRTSSILNFESSLVAVFTDFKHRIALSKTDAEKTTAAARFLWNLNLKLTGCIFKGQRYGWIFYYSQITETGILRKIDNTVLSLRTRFKTTALAKSKKILKSFYESKRIDKATHRYIPNFDILTISQKRHLLAEVGVNVNGLSDIQISVQFSKIIRRAVKSLEKDIGDVS